MGLQIPDLNAEVTGLCMFGGSACICKELPAKHVQQGILSCVGTCRMPLAALAAVFSARLQWWKDLQNLFERVICQTRPIMRPLVCKHCDAGACNWDVLDSGTP